MKDISVAAGVAAALVLLLTGTAIAKGGLSHIKVTGPDLEHPIEISDTPILDQFNPWGGLHRFLAERLDEEGVRALALEGPYEVRFSQRFNEWVYAFSYYFSAGSGTGYIVLPEPPTSQGFIHPAGWYRSTEAWSQVMSEQLEGIITWKQQGGSWIGDAAPRLVVAMWAISLLGVAVVVTRRRRASPGRDGALVVGSNHD